MGPDHCQSLELQTNLRVPHLTLQNQVWMINLTSKYCFSLNTITINEINLNSIRDKFQ